MGALSDSRLGDILLQGAGSAEELKYSADQLMGSRAMISDAGMDYNEIEKMLVNIIETDLVELASNPELAQQLSVLGMSFDDTKRALESGDFMGVTNNILDSMNSLLEENPEVARNALKSVGWEEEFIRNVELFHDDVSSNYAEIIGDFGEYKDNLDSTLDNYPAALTEKLMNGLSTWPVINDIVNILGSIGLSITDLYFLFATGKAILSTAKGIGSLFGIGVS